MSITSTVFYDRAVATASVSGTGGRPPRQVRSTPRRPGWYGCEDRVAWLLRSNRLYGKDSRLRGLAAFAAAFPGGSWPGGVSPSLISRWETGASRAGYRVLRRYEELLGLSVNRLVAVADWTYRKVSGGIGPPVLARDPPAADPSGRQRIEELLERALSAEVMSGAEWTELTGLLAVLPNVLLYPRRSWADLAERLLGELFIADGVWWASRIEALSRLAVHPGALQAIVTACGSLARDPTNQIIIEPLTILDMTGARAANRQVLSQLANPSSDRALRGALLASIEKLPRRHYRPEELHLIAAVTADLLDTDDLSLEARQLATEMLRQAVGTGLDPAVEAVRRRLERRMGNRGDPVTRSIIRFGRTASPTMVELVVERTVAVASAGLGITRPDPMLAQLISELLFSPNANDRVLAGLIIAATPYRDPVGAAIAAQLAETASAPTASGHRVSLTAAMLGAMPFVGRSADRAMVERFVLNTAPQPVADAAAWALGHVPGRSATEFWRKAVRARRRAQGNGRAPATEPTLRGILYSLGVQGEVSMLREVRSDVDLPAPARIAAAWWLRIPALTRASAAQ